MQKVTLVRSARAKRAHADLVAAAGSALDATTVIALKRHAEAIRSLVRRASSDIIEIGQRLTKAQELAGHGNWLRWLDREFGWSEQTARNYMRVFEMARSTTLLWIWICLCALSTCSPRPVRQNQPAKR